LRKRVSKKRRSVKKEDSMLGPDRCPFCGSTRLVKHDYEWIPRYPGAYKWWRLKCKDCGHLVRQYKKLTPEEAARGDLFYTEPYWPPCPSCGYWGVIWKPSNDHYVCRNCGQEYTPAGKPVNQASDTGVSR